MLLPPDVKNFSPEMHVVACYINVDEQYLILKRHQNKPYGGLWCFPGGKIDKGETPLEAVKRETLEETGIVLPSPQPFKGYFVRYPEFDFTFIAYTQTFNKMPEVRLKTDEHTNSTWVPPGILVHFPLIPDEEECFKEYISQK